MVSQKKDNRRIFILDDLRGIAILTVIFYHYFYVYYLKIDSAPHFFVILNKINDYFNLGEFGVGLFFLVSGYVIPMTLKKSHSIKEVYSFFIKRFFRLFPTYYFSIFVIVLSAWLFSVGKYYSFYQIIINMTMFQDILKVPHIDGVFWTLTIELKFYIITAVIVYFGLLHKIKYIIFLLLILSLISLYLHYTINLTGFIQSRISYIMLMYLGTAYYLYNKNIINKNSLMILTVSVCCYFLINHIFLVDNLYGNKIGYSLAILGAILVFTISINYKKRLSNISTFFGNISYSLYLIHQVLGYMLISYISNTIDFIVLPQVITFLAMVIFSYMIFKYIEIPSNKIGHKIVK